MDKGQERKHAIHQLRQDKLNVQKEYGRRREELQDKLNAMQGPIIAWEQEQHKKLHEDLQPKRAALEVLEASKKLLIRQIADMRQEIDFDFTKGQAKIAEQVEAKRLPVIQLREDETRKIEKEVDEKIAALKARMRALRRRR